MLPATTAAAPATPNTSSSRVEKGELLEFYNKMKGDAGTFSSTEKKVNISGLTAVKIRGFLSTLKGLGFSVPSLDTHGLGTRQKQIDFIKDSAEDIEEFLSGDVFSPYTPPPGAAVPTSGRGVRPKMKGSLSQKDIDYSSGIQATKRFSPFGRYVINKTRLINDDIVSISRPSGNRIKEFPSRRVS